jgi:hypothetical protein
MAKRIPHVTGLAVQPGYWLRLTFDDGLTGDVDLSRLIERGGVFAPLHDRKMFAQAVIDPAAHTVAWPDRQLDLDPEGLHEMALEHPVAVKRRRRLRLNSLVKQARAAL